MIRTHWCPLKSIGKRIVRRFHQKISNVPVENEDPKSSKSNKNTQESKTETDANCTKKSELKDYDFFLPDRKGDIKVCVIGGGAVSAYTAVLLKQSRIIKSVNLVDTKDSMAGTILDASHIDTSTRLKYFKRKNVKQALKDMNIIALMDETDPNMTDLSPKAQIEAAAMYVHEAAEQMVKCCSESLVAVFTRPVTATLPMVSEVYKLAGWWDPDRIIGSTALDRMRLEAITANLFDLNPAFLSIPLVGGADPYTIVPLLSRASPTNQFTSAQQETLLQSLRGADQQMASIEYTGPILSAGAAAAKLILLLAGGLSGFENVITSAYVRSNVLPVCRFFTSELQFGAGGVQKNFGLPKMSASEVLMVEQAIPFINQHTDIAIKTIHNNRHITLKCA